MKRLAAEHDIVLVEGAGGLLVPLTRQENFLDLAARLDLPILVVARNVLGTINHTALTVIVASQRCHVSGIVLNTVTAEVQDASQASNAEALRIWGRAPLLGRGFLYDQKSRRRVCSNRARASIFRLFWLSLLFSPNEVPS